MSFLLHNLQNRRLTRGRIHRISDIPVLTPPERIAGLTALGAIVLAMMTVYVIHSIAKERNK